MWNTVRVLRKEKCFSVTVGQDFNLETVTGLKYWNDPKFLISIPHYKSVGGFVDTRVEIKEKSYPIFSVISVGNSFYPNSTIDVFVIEGDRNTVNNISGNRWQTSKIINSKTGLDKFTLRVNSSNNYSANLPSGIDISKYKIFYMFNKIYFDSNMVGYDINNSISGNTIKVDITSKNATRKLNAKSLSIRSPEIFNAKVFSIFSVLGNFQGISSEPNSWKDNFYIYIYVNGVKTKIDVLVDNVSMDIYHFISLNPLILHNVSGNITIEFKGEYKTHTTSNSNINVYSIYADINDTKIEHMTDYDLTLLFIKV